VSFIEKVRIEVRDLNRSEEAAEEDKEGEEEKWWGLARPCQSGVGTSGVSFAVHSSEEKPIILTTDKGDRIEVPRGVVCLRAHFHPPRSTSENEPGVAIFVNLVSAILTHQLISHHAFDYSSQPLDVIHKSHLANNGMFDFFVRTGSLSVRAFVDTETV